MPSESVGVGAVEGDRRSVAVAVKAATGAVFGLTTGRLTVVVPVSPSSSVTVSVTA